ncbi:MAG TPA: hypothetical protein PK562_01935, partial [Candidatus Omnitrophota bacterium]|nr:hypothetical protein [Candidatus Omnitrophota bacterium]
MKHSFLAILMCMMSACCLAEETRSQPKYVILAWSGSGMHFYSEDFQDAAILPPNNTLMCQVIKVGEPPQIVKSGVIVEYRFRDNTFSAGKDSKRDKTNFWKFARKLFGVDAEVNKGLTGKGLSGLMDAAGVYFIAQGIPITEYRDGSVADIDRGLWERYPFQLAAIVVKDEKTGVELARTSVV